MTGLTHRSTSRAIDPMLSSYSLDFGKNRFEQGQEVGLVVDWYRSFLSIAFAEVSECRYSLVRIPDDVWAKWEISLLNKCCSILTRRDVEIYFFERWNTPENQELKERKKKRCPSEQIVQWERLILLRRSCRLPGENDDLGFDELASRKQTSSFPTPVEWSSVRMRERNRSSEWLYYLLFHPRSSIYE